MKRYIFLTALIAASYNTPLYAINAEKADTLVSISRPSSVLITETPQGIMLDIKSEDDPKPSSILIADYNDNVTVSANQHTSRFQAFTSNGCAIGVKAKSGWDVISGGFNIGLVNSTGQPDGMNLQWAKSFELSWVNAFALRYSYRSVSLSLGLGFDWRNYNMTTHNHRMIPDATTGIAIAPYPEGSTPGNSRIKVFSLGFPLLYTQRIPGTTLSFTAGGIFNLNTHASLKTHYTDDSDNHIEEYSESISRRRISFDLYGSLHLYKGVGIYIRYSPQSVLSGAAVPEFRPMSVGISLFM